MVRGWGCVMTSTGEGKGVLAVRSASAAFGSAAGVGEPGSSSPVYGASPERFCDFGFALNNPRQVNSNSRSSYVRSMSFCGGKRAASSMAGMDVSGGLEGQDGSFGSMEVEYLDSWKENLVGEPRVAGGVGVGADADWFWTGKKPVAGASLPGVSSEGKVTSLPLPDYKTASREELLAYFDNTWMLTETLFSSLATEAAYYRPPWHDLRHPMIFYYGHPAAVYINKFRVAGLRETPVSPFLEKIYETGVDEMSWDDMHKNAMRWPSIAHTNDYRRAVYNEVAESIVSSHHYESLAELGPASPFWAVLMGFEHERIHLETSSVLIRELPLSDVVRPQGWPHDFPNIPAPGASPSVPKSGVDYPENSWVTLRPDGPVVLGKPSEETTYGWDNEFGTKALDVAPFSVAKHLVTNGEMYEFVASDGYLNPKYWSADGWAWRTFRNVKWPTFWRQVGPAGLHEYNLRLVFEETDMPWAWPADLNYYEVEAYANYVAEKTGKATRPLKEAEHAVMREAYTSPDVATRPGAGATLDVPAGIDMDSLSHNPNLNLTFGSHNSVDGLAPSPDGIHDVVGNIWQWCDDHFSPLPGFDTHAHYPDFSLPCFDGKHNVIMGGSFASTGNVASAHARFHFRPHFYQHAGARLVQPLDSANDTLTSCAGCEGPYVGAESPYRVQPKSTAPFSSSSSSSSSPSHGGKFGGGNGGDDDGRGPKKPQKVGSTAGVVEKYEDQIVLDQYMNMHYGKPADFPAYVPAEHLAFPQRCARVVEEHTLAGNARARALDVGCAVGGSAFELARTFEHVTALDISRAFVDAAKTVQQEKAVAYSVRREGNHFDDHVAVLDPSVDASRVHFDVGDATALDVAELGTFDGVLVGNVLCRLPDPNLLLDALPGLVNPDGTLVITSPFSWLPQFTNESMWLSTPAGNSAAALIERLDADFDLVDQGDIAFVIREHIRKYEYVAAHLGVWRRRQ